MKNIICILFAALVISVAEAQKIGLKAGLNYSNVAGELTKESTYQSKIGFHGGLTSNFKLLGEFLSLQPELLYSQKGYNYRNDEVTIDGIEYENKGKVNFSYLDLPVLARIKKGGIYFEGGPQLSYLVSIQEKTEVSVNNIEDKNVRSIDKGNMEDFEIGYAAGIGFQAGNGLNLNVRYNSSFQDFSRDSSNEDLANARHSVFQVQVGFLFNP